MSSPTQRVTLFTRTGTHSAFKGCFLQLNGVKPPLCRYADAHVETRVWCLAPVLLHLQKIAEPGRHQECFYE